MAYNNLLFVNILPAKYRNKHVSLGVVTIVERRGNLSLRYSRLSFTAIAKTTIRFNGELSRCVRRGLSYAAGYFLPNETSEKGNWSPWTLPLFFANRRFCKKWIASEGYAAALCFVFESPRKISSRAWAHRVGQQETQAEAALEVITLSRVKHN